MEQVLDFIGRYGAPVVFAVVFLDQLGLPIPTVPILLALGALAGNGRIDPLGGLLLAVSGSLCADLVWFRLGRWKGARALGLLCKIALEPDTCVNKTRDLFAKHGVKSLLVAKFVPGFDTVAPPLAGMLGVGVARFLLWSAAGAVVWIGTFGGLGYLFSERLEELAGSADRLGGQLVSATIGLVAIYVAWKYVARQRVLRSIRTARVTPEELHAMIERGQEPVIVDARTHAALEAFPFVIEGARFLTLEELDARHAEIPRGKDVVVYCA